jgi:hypothetical protein
MFVSMLIRSYATDTILWQLRDQDPICTWTKGKLILIGDAAHAMLPRINLFNFKLMDQIKDKVGVNQSRMPKHLRLRWRIPLLVMYPSN